MDENQVATNEETQGTEETQQEEKKTYTAEEVMKLIQSETDKRVSQALKTQEKKYQKQLPAELLYPKPQYTLLYPEQEQDYEAELTYRSPQFLREHHRQQDRIL